MNVKCLKVKSLLKDLDFGFDLLFGLWHLSFWKKLLCLLFTVHYLLVALPALANSTPPITTHSQSGVLGNNGWYQSDIDVTLTTQDQESGPARTTYWIDANPPTTVEHTVTPVDPFLNPSFEKGWFFNIKKWYAGLGGIALYYRSSINAKDGNKSAAIAFVDFGGDDFYHWHNEPHAIEFPVGEDIEISAWVRTVMGSDDQAYFEVWGQESSGLNDQLLGTSDIITGFHWSWQNVTAQLTVPSGVNYLYLKLGALGSPAAIIYWDHLETRNVNKIAEVNFNFSEEGNHTLHYFSEDFTGNIENEKTTQLKKDTVLPNPWQIFSSNRTTCNHCYEASVEVKDTTSGVDVSTAEYRFYTEHAEQFWSDWLPVTSVTKAGTAVPAVDGETDFVTLSIPEIDFGDSSTWPFRVQFRILDMAGNFGLSPVYEIVAPWIKAWNGSIYIGGEISVPYPSSGDNHANGDVMTLDDIVSFSTSTNWTDQDYEHAGFGAATISTLIPAYLDIKTQAISLSGSQLPTSDGVYIVNGNFEIDNSALSGYESADVSTVIIITGDLSIMDGFSVIDENNTVFLVEGNLLVKQNVEEMAGFYLVAGQFDSDISGKSKKPLGVDGSVIALAGYILPRNLGESGPENNSNTAAEQFYWQPDLVLDPVLAEYLTNKTVQYVWQEVVKP